ncbi:leucine rich repeat [Borealophlyctis nickersoniae]|nr:leucine rich repeat [Borealophlyctis nickersoniae]
MTEIAHVDAGLSSLRDVVPLIRRHERVATENGYDNVEVRVLNLHSNNIRRVEGDVLGMLRGLTVLDFSSNLIEKIEGLEAVPNLVELNLSNNKLSCIEGLRSLYKLKRLILSFNRIQTLEGMVELHGDYYSLRYLDLKGNRIPDTSQLHYLAGCTKLQDLVLRSDHPSSQTNPVSKLPTYTGATVFGILPQLRSLDGKDLEGSPVADDPLCVHLDISQYSVDVPDRLNGHRKIKPRKPFEPSQCAPSPQKMRGTTPHFGSQKDRIGAENLQDINVRIHGMEAQLRALFGDVERPDRFGKSVAPGTTERIDRLEKQLAELPRDVAANGPSQPPMNARKNDGSQDRLSRLEGQLSQLLEALLEEPKGGKGKGKGKAGTVQEAGARRSAENEPAGQVGSSAKRLSVEDELEKEYRRQYLLWRKKKLQEDDENRELDYTNQNTKAKCELYHHALLAVTACQPLHQDAKRRSLVWRDDEAERDQVPEKEASNPKRATGGSNSATSKTGKPTTPTGYQSVPATTLAANAKLISALEDEEKRLRQNEARYAEQVKALTEKLAAEEAKAKMVEATCAELTLKVEGDGVMIAGFKEKLERLEGESLENGAQIEKSNVANAELTAKLANTEATLRELDKRNSELSAANDILMTQMRERQEEVEGIKRAACDSEIALADAEQRLRLCEDEQSRLSVRFVKDREQLKVKLAQSKREIEMYKTTIKQLQKDLSTLQTKISTQEADSRQQLQEILSGRANELSTLLGQITERLTEKHKVEMETVTRALNSTREAYSALEEEFRKGIKAEQTRYGELQTAFNELSYRSAEQARMLSEAGQKDTERTSMIKELTVLVKEQKAKIAELNERNQMSFSIFEEKVHALEENLADAQKAHGELQKMQRELAEARAESTAKQLAIDELISERQRLQNELAKQTRIVEEEKQKLEAKMKGLEEEKNDAVRSRESDEQALRVKTKMLEDQNDTIRKLKQNLENKTREHQTLINDSAKREEALEEQIDAERRANREMRHEIDSQEKLIDHLQVIVDEYKEERDALRKEVVEISKRLKDRNDSIQRIEEEVAKVRKIFKAKEEKLLQERKDALRAKDDESAELRQAFEAQSARMAVFDRERDAMLQTIKRLQREVDSASFEKERHEAEMRVLVVEMERQKQKMEDKMAKVKAAFSDL